MINTENEEIQELTLDTFYRQKFENTIKPGDEMNFIETAQDWIKARANDNCVLRVLPKGHIELEETTFKDKLEALKSFAEEARVTISHGQYQSVQEVLTHPLYQRFKEKLTAREHIPDEDTVKEKAIEAMSRLIAKGEIQL